MSKYQRQFRCSVPNETCGVLLEAATWSIFKTITCNKATLDNLFSFLITNIVISLYRYTMYLNSGKANVNLESLVFNKTEG